MKNHIQARSFIWRIHWGQFWDRVRFVISRDWMEVCLYILVLLALLGWSCMIFDVWGEWQC